MIDRSHKQVKSEGIHPKLSEHTIKSLFSAFFLPSRILAPKEAKIN
jgi:hypothetical protein